MKYSYNHNTSINLCKIKALVLAFILAYMPTIALPADYLLTSFSLSEGISNPSVKSVLRDSKDYLWIGTQSGLNRVDKGKTTTYKRNPAIHNSLPDNEIIEIFEDEKETIWVICNTGISSYDRATDSFIPVLNNGNSIRARSHLLTPSGIIFGGAGCLFFYDYESGNINTNIVRDGSDYYFTAIHPWSRDRYLLATNWDGMWIYNTKTSQTEPFSLFTGKRIIASLIDSEGSLWISEFGEGVHLITKSGDVHHKVIPEFSYPAIVLDIHECSDCLIFASDGQGILKFDKSSRKAERINASENFTSSLRSVNCIYHDKYDNIYAGTVRGGLILMQESPFQTIGASPEFDAFTVTSIVESANKYWVGIDGGGIVLYEPDKGNVLTPMPETEGLKIVSMDNYDANSLLISTYNKGLHLFNKNTGSLTPAPNWIQKISEENKSSGIPMDIRRLPGNRIAIIADRIYISDLVGNEVSVIEPGDNNHGRLRVFFSDMENLLCYNNQEVFRIDLEEETATSLFKLKDQFLECAVFDGKRYIYAGTSAGVEQYDFETGVLTSPGNSLTSGSGISAIAFNDNKLWIGALGKLFTRDAPDGIIRRFGQEDGVAPNQFIYKAVISSPKYLLMGGVNGLLKVNIQEVEEYDSKRNIIPIRLAEVFVDGKPISMNGNVAKLPDSYSNVKLRVVGGNPNPLMPSPIRLFIGRGNLKSPIETSDNTLTLGHPEDSRGGRYDIYASVVGKDGKWSEPTIIGSIMVPSSWWRRPIAIIFICVLAVAAIILSLFYFLSYRKNKASKRMEIHRRQSLEKEVGFLMNLNYELRTPLTLIYSRIKMLTDKVSKGNVPEEKVIEELDRIYQSTGKMRDIINTTVDLWRSGDMKTGEIIEKTNVEELIKEATSEVRGLANDKKITIDTSKVDEEVSMVCDHRRSLVAILNVMRSTINHAAEKTSISIETKDLGDHIKILISFFNDDSHGAGEEFRYADHLMALMDGELTYTRKEKGNPSVIIMDFPKVLIRQAQSAGNLPGTMENAKNLEKENKALDKLDEVSGLDLSPLTALIVEDDTELRELLVTSLSSVFNRVVEASNGIDALTSIKNFNPDLIITEARLPQMTGLELCRTIKNTKEYSHIPVIMLTTLLEEMSIANGNNYGADNYLTKPFDISVLKNRCESVLKSFDRVKQWYRSQASDILPSDRRQTNDAEAFILKVKKIIEQNVNKGGFGVDEIVDKMLVSRSTLYNRFKELTGQSLGNYINDYKLNKAKEMLASTNMTMVEISDALGFTTQRYFSTFFKDKTGLTPSAFRAQNQNIAVE